LYSTEENFILLAEELPAKLRQGGKFDTEAAISLLENICELELTHVMLSKNIIPVQNIYNLTKLNINAGVDNLPPNKSKVKFIFILFVCIYKLDNMQESRRKDNEKIKMLAQKLMAKFKVIY